MTQCQGLKIKDTSGISAVYQETWKQLLKIDKTIAFGFHANLNDSN